MCGDNWRSLGEVLADVTELALVKSMATEGSGVTRALPPPPQSTHRDVLRFDSGRPQTRGELAGRPPMRTGLGAPSAILELGPDRDRWRLDEIDGPGQGVVAYPAGSAGHCMPTTGMRRTIAVPQPQEAALPPAIVYLMLAIEEHSAFLQNVAVLLLNVRDVCESAVLAYTSPCRLDGGITALVRRVADNPVVKRDHRPLQGLAQFIPLSNEGADGGLVTHARSSSR